MTNIDPALMQKIFYIPQRQREPHVHHDGQANDFRGGLKVAKGVLILHPARIGPAKSRLNPFSSDNAHHTPSPRIQN